MEQPAGSISKDVDMIKFFFDQLSTWFSLLTGNLAFLTFLFAVIFGLLGLILLVVSLSNIKADQRCKDWPGVQGKIASSRIEKVYVRVRGRSSARYLPVIKYSYEVNGTAHQGARVGNGMNYGSHLTKMGAQQWKKRYPAGKEIMVYYNPADPGEALLVKFTLENIFGFIFSLVLCAGGIYSFGMFIYYFFFLHYPFFPE